jgi:hypothetical protein
MGSVTHDLAEATVAAQNAPFKRGVKDADRSLLERSPVTFFAVAQFLFGCLLTGDVLDESFEVVQFAVSPADLPRIERSPELGAIPAFEAAFEPLYRPEFFDGPDVCGSAGWICPQIPADVAGRRQQIPGGVIPQHSGERSVGEQQAAIGRDPVDALQRAIESILKLLHYGELLLLSPLLSGNVGRQHGDAA